MRVLFIVTAVLMASAASAQGDAPPAPPVTPAVVPSVSATPAPPPATTDAPAAAVPAPAPVPPPRIYATVRVVLTTSLGPIKLELEKERAPLTTANFLRYVDQKRYDGAVFYRAMKLWSPDVGIVQGGVRNDPKKVLKPVAHEPTSKTGLTHGDGAISLARLAPGTAAAEFFITLGAVPGFDADPAAKGDNQGFAVFGRVTEGMDVVRKMLAAPTSATEGKGVMKGQMLARPVQIISARRVR